MTTRGPVLRLLAAVGVMVAAVIGYWWLQSPPATKIKVGVRVPELQLPTLGATSHTRLSQFRGRPTLLTMFTTRCPRCDEELPRIERLHREFLKRGLVVLGVGTEANPLELAGLVKRHTLTFFVMHDPDGVAIREAFGTRRLPETYLIDRDGIVRAIYLGDVVGKIVELREQIEALLGPGGV
jgi:peroxiredoxin